ncbi:hypothetical protein [Mycobacterium montefiorense]|uniref:hypothetical protein n=1 Tax=Mycobacterium montefiorense TaxID=154654 RepID=UPI0021DC1B40|nr:hypothetical protein [Mycobacterium montefiorense]MCV7428071.1 hypothetical protein [Mycobacterium montefiorense]GLE52528.1 hypothetical protein ATCCBAA256_20920 [Mycobacterium montefiorense]
MKSIEDLPAQVIAEMLISHMEVLVERGDMDGADEVWRRIDLPGVSSVADLRRYAAKLDDGAER